MNKSYSFILAALLFLLSEFMLVSAEGSNCGNCRPTLARPDGQQKNKMSAFQSDAKLESSTAREKRRVLTAINEMNDERLHWQSFRNKVYGEVFGLNEEHLARLESTRAEYQRKIEAILPLGKSNQSPLPKAIGSQLQAMANEFDEKVAKIIGGENFQTLLQWRDYYNQELRVSAMPNSRISNVW